MNAGFGMHAVAPAATGQLKPPNGFAAVLAAHVPTAAAVVTRSNRMMVSRSTNGLFACCGVIPTGNGAGAVLVTHTFVAGVRTPPTTFAGSAAKLTRSSYRSP